MRRITLIDALWVSLLISILLFSTGVATIPFAAKHDVLTQNFIYLWGRIPVVFAALIIYFNLGKKSE